MHQYDIIDFHNHIFPGKIVRKAVDAIGAFYASAMEGVGSPEDLLADGKKAGVSRFVVHSAATTPAQVQHINEFIHDEAQKHPEFIPFATLHPFMDDLEAEVDRILSWGMPGIKLHPDFQQFNLDDPRALEMYRIVGDRAIFLLHMGDATRSYSAPERLARVLDRFPSLRVIGAHFGGYNAWEQSRRYLVGRDLYFDTSSSLFKLTTQEALDMMHDHGVEKMLYGTDYPMWTHEEELGRFDALPLSEQERQMIFHDNGAKLLGL